MDGKFAILSYAKEGDIKNDIISKVRHKINFPLEMTETRILDESGYTVTLPITKSEAIKNENYKNDVYLRTLDRLLMEGVTAIKLEEGAKYDYDHIIPAASGAYILPFLLPQILKKGAKSIGVPLEKAKILIADEMADLTLDILCVITQYTNYIKIFTDNVDYFNQVSENIYEDGGINIHLTDTLEYADILLSTKKEAETGLNFGGFYFNMLRDSVSLKADNEYFDNVTLDTIMLARCGSFRKYVYGKFFDKDFYKVLDVVEKLNIKVTEFGKH